MDSVFSYKPEGLRDFLPELASIKREAEDKLYNGFKQWGFEEVITPTFEYLETFLMGYNLNSEEKIFKFLDRKGRVLALRPDMTTPIARIVANYYKKIDAPLRLCYFSNIFMFEESRGGRQLESYQAGAELIGVSGLEWDAEMISLAVESLKRLGIKDFKVSVGHTGFLKGILDRFEDEKIKNKIHGCFLNKDFVELKKILNSSVSDEDVRKLVMHLTSSSGNLDTLEGYNCFDEYKIISGAVTQLQEIRDLLKIYGVEGYTAFDPSLIRALDYYTGIIFEIYSPSIGFPLCGGGRYDTLIEKFNGSYPATGFAFNIEGILEILVRQKEINKKEERHYLICYDDLSKIKAIKKAVELRKKGYITEIYKSENMCNGIEYGKEKGFKKVIIINNIDEEIINLNEG